MEWDKEREEMGRNGREEMGGWGKEWVEGEETDERWRE